MVLSLRQHPVYNTWIVMADVLGTSSNFALHPFSEIQKLCNSASFHSSSDDSSPPGPIMNVTGLTRSRISGYGDPQHSVM